MAKVNKELKMEIHNRFDFEVVDCKTGEIKQKARAYNVVCNTFFTAIINGYTASNILFGSGNGTPSASDTTLFTYVGYASTTSGYDSIYSDEEYEGIWRRVIKRTIQYNQNVGATITEVGLARSTSGEILTHAMLQDMNGNPISIVHTDTDIINIYCTIYLHYDGQDSDIHWYIVKNLRSDYGVKYVGFVHRALLNNASGGNMITWTNCYGNTGRQDMDADGSRAAWCSLAGDAANKRLTLTMSRMATTAGNVSGIRFLYLHHSSYSYGVNYGTMDALIEVGGANIPPATITNESVGVGDGTTSKFKTKFLYPYNATVYINGVAQATGVAVKKTRLSAHSQESVKTTQGFDFGGTSWPHMTPLYKENVKLPKPNAYYQFNTDTFNNGYIIRLDDVEVGLYRINAPNGTVKASNDGETWVDVPTNTSNVQMDQNYAHYKYYQFNGTANADAYMNTYDGYNIVFDTPPAQGDVITIDYTTDTIPKDSDHVLDLTLTFTFGEWTGE